MMDLENSEIVIERAKKGLCPICGLLFSADEKEESIFEYYKGKKIQIHKRHIREKLEILS